MNGTHHFVAIGVLMFLIMTGKALAECILNGRRLWKAPALVRSSASMARGQRSQRSPNLSTEVQHARSQQQSDAGSERHIVQATGLAGAT